MEEYINQYNIFADKLGESIITWARPEGWVPGPTSVSYYD